MPGTSRSGVGARQSQVVSFTYGIIINGFPLLDINSLFLASIDYKSSCTNELVNSIVTVFLD